MNPSVANGISTGEDDLTLLLTKTLYRVSITITVHKSAPGTDPGEANPQSLTGDALHGHGTAHIIVKGARLVNTFSGAAIPPGRAVVAARFDFTSARQNQKGVHQYRQDRYTVRYATTPKGPLTTLTGHF